jgi:hypothetical protein
MTDILFVPVFTATLSPDCYDGSECDGIRPLWLAHAYGDMESEHSDSDITLICNRFPPGTRVTVSEPLCPGCGIPAGESWDDEYGQWTGPCDCGFNWIEWTLTEFG